MELFKRVIFYTVTGALLLGFALSLAYCFCGSFETFPTAEQAESSKIGAIVMTALFGIPCVGCIVYAVYKKARKEK